MKLLLVQWMSVLAQQVTTGPEGGSPDQTAPQGGPTGNTTVVLVGLGLMMLVFLWITGRGRRKEQATREKMLNELKRNDKVVTIGGMVGVVTDVKDDEVVVKVDESANAKVRMKKWAVRSLLSQEEDKSDEKK